MGMFEQYILQGISGPALDVERRKFLGAIGAARNTAVIAYSARCNPGPAPFDPSILFEDVLPFSDLMDGLAGKRVSVVIETTGGIGEVGRQLVEMLHERFEWVEFIVPGMALSTGTIMCLGAHEILMGAGSSLGPIDAQLRQDGKQYSADALIEGFEEIKANVVANNGQLNPAYIPILSRISPGELKNAHNALEFARATVTDWLARYKFANWEKNGVPVTPEHKAKRAREIAEKLAKQAGNWHTHGRQLRIPDLEAIGLKVFDMRTDAALYELVQRYYILTRLTFEQTAVYKIYETAKSTIAKSFQIQVPPQALQQAVQQAAAVQVVARCEHCGLEQPFQLDLVPNAPRQPGAVPFPSEPELPCPRCGKAVKFDAILQGVEQQLGRKAHLPKPGQ